jgi:inorganic triphosphatase YgiF
LSLNVLQATPWAKSDPDGTVFQALTPIFSTTFERTSWTVRRRDGSVIEVALDIGLVVAGDKRAPICELELELKAGQPAALFDLAQQIAATIAVLPANVSKAERGYALARDGLDMPLRAQPPKLSKQLSVPAVAGRVLREMFCQFTTNLNALRNSDDPEVVHQARVGWRRLKSALRLFKPALAVNAGPSWQALQPMLSFLGELRDIDVARAETLPPLEDTYVAGDARRADSWRAMTQSLLQEAKLQRKSVRYALEDPAVGATLLVATQWIEELSTLESAKDAGSDAKVSFPRWSKRRLKRLHRQLKIARNDTNSPASVHRVRILAKRLRYGIETLRAFLPKRRAHRWYRQATNLQLKLGANRDGMQAGALLAKLDEDRGLIEFVRGVAIGKARQP